MINRFLFFLLIGFFNLSAQTPAAITFRKDSHDFGLVEEKRGPVSHHFYFRNNGAVPITVGSVETSCGCTVTEWTADPVDPGKEGQIKAVFDPEGRPGYFNKTITVIFSPDSTPVNLQIRGQVSENVKVVNTLLEHEDGQLKTRSAGFNLGKVFINQDPVFRHFILFNSGDSDLLITDTQAPAHLQVNAPSKIKPGNAESVSIKFNPKKFKKFGLHTDQLVLQTNDPINPEKHFSVYATIEEFFPVMSPSELEQAPRLTLSASEIKFPGMQQSSVLERELIYRNTGKKPLLIRSVIPNCSCLTAQTESDSLAPGASARMKIKFTPSGRSGRQIKSIMIYSNDPQHPVQKVTLNGLVSE